MSYLLKNVPTSSFVVGLIGVDCIIGVIGTAVHCRYTEKHAAQQTIATLRWLDAHLGEEEKDKLYLNEALRRQEAFVSGYGLFRPHVDWKRIPMNDKLQIQPFQ